MSAAPEKCLGNVLHGITSFTSFTTSHNPPTADKDPAIKFICICSMPFIGFTVQKKRSLVMFSKPVDLCKNLGRTGGLQEPKRTKWIKMVHFHSHFCSPLWRRGLAKVIKSGSQVSRLGKWHCWKCSLVCHNLHSQRVLEPHRHHTAQLTTKKQMMQIFLRSKKLALHHLPKINRSICPPTAISSTKHSHRSLRMATLATLKTFITPALQNWKSWVHNTTRLDVSNQTKSEMLRFQLKNPLILGADAACLQILSSISNFGKPSFHSKNNMDFLNQNPFNSKSIPKCEKTSPQISNLPIFHSNFASDIGRKAGRNAVLRGERIVSHEFANLHAAGAMDVPRGPTTGMQHLHLKMEMEIKCALGIRDMLG